MKEKGSKVNKGTAFVKFSYKEACDRAIDAGNIGDGVKNFVSGKKTFAGDEVGDGGIMIDGRRLLVDRAVDRSTAETLKVDRDEDGKAIKRGRDKRNLYLKNEGTISNSAALEELPRLDREKRERAISEKNTKLRSPLFFINGTRLSIRNLSKSVDEAGLKRLLVAALKTSLAKNRVTPKDVSNQLRAQGLPERECIGETAKVPPFNEKNVKMFIPSLFIDKDILELKDGKKEVGQSKGYGFVDFAHHVHALAVLRELNNNTDYTREYVMHGSKASDLKKGVNVAGDKRDFMSEGGGFLLPRLVVEFACENMAKSKLQTERREKKRVNAEKQKEQNKSSKKEKSESALSRGAKQREKKRKRKAEAGALGVAEEDINDEEEKGQSKSGAAAKAPPLKKKAEEKTIPPPKSKKQLKEEKAENDFGALVKKHIGAASEQGREGGEEGKKKKRWFD